VRVKPSSRASGRNARRMIDLQSHVGVGGADKRTPPALERSRERVWSRGRYSQHSVREPDRPISLSRFLGKLLDKFRSAPRREIATHDLIDAETR
jgi:hypothetical protein